MARTDPRSHATPLRDLSERMAFVLTFVVGVAGIILLKALALDPYVVAGFAAGMIVAYMLTSMVLGRLQIEPELVGDNCYYLGFLFTLTSLSYTLSQLVGTEGDAIAREELIGRVISGFGVALSSTIVGVFLRVVLMQIRPDIVARDREMHIELNDSVRELRRQLAVSLGTFKQFTVESVQMAAERDRRIEAELGGVLATLATRMDDTTRQGMEAIRTMQEAAAGALVDTTTARVEASLARSMDQMGQAFAALAQAAETLSRRDHDASAALLARFDAVGQSLDGMAGQVATLSRRFEEVGDSVDTSRIGAAASAMSSALSDGAVSIREATVTLQTSAEASAASIDQASRALVDQMEARRRGFRLFGNAKG